MARHERRFGLGPLCGAIVLGALFVPAGCAVSPDSVRKPTGGSSDVASKILPGRQDAAFKKKVDADKFPTAQEAGIP